MNIFDSVLPTEPVTLKKRDGSVVENIKARVNSNSISVPDTTLDFDEQDTILRPLPNGKIERYTILEAEYRPGLYEIPARYQLRVRKETAISSQQYSQIVNNFHVSGANSRINFQSTDLSTNTYTGNSQSVFADMRQVSLKIEPEEDRQKVVDAIDALEPATGTPDGAHWYSNFIQAAANHMTLFSPFIPALTQMFIGSHGG